MATRKTRAKPRAKGGSSKASAKARRLAFAEAYLSSNENITKAALAVGFSPKTAASQGSRLLKHVEVQQIIQQRRAESLALARANTNLTVEGVLRSVARAVLFDPRKLFKVDGTALLPHELDDETALAVDGVEVELDKKTGRPTWAKYKTGRGLAREQAIKHLGLFKEDNGQTMQPVADAMLKIASMDPLKAKFQKLLGGAKA